jgi:hypothetical protein
MIAYQFPYIFTKKNCIPVSDVTHNYLLSRMCGFGRKPETETVNSDDRSIFLVFAGTSTEQVRRHFSEEAPHQQGP